MTIVDALIAEHRVFMATFDAIDRQLDSLITMREVRLFCHVLLDLVRGHGREECDLAYLALDHILKERAQQTRLYHDHQELEHLLEEAARSNTLPVARARLRTAMEACRAHFREEERVIFPLIQEALQPETLQVLGRAWKP